MVRRNSDEENSRRVEGNSETTRDPAPCQTEVSFRKDFGAGIESRGADGGTVVPVYVVATGGCER